MRASWFFVLYYDFVEVVYLLDIPRFSYLVFTICYVAMRVHDDMIYDMDLGV